MSSLAGTNSNAPAMPSTSPSSVVGSTLPHVANELAARFHRLRFRYRRWLAALTAANLLSAVGVAWLIWAACDYGLEISDRVRVSGLVVLGCTVASIIGWSIAGILRQCSPKQFAMALEERFEEIGQRLRTILELTAGQLIAPMPMLSALAHQTMARWETSQPEQILPRRQLWVSLVMLGLVIVACSASLFSGSEMRTAMLRTAGWNVPYTTLHVTPGNTKLLEGLQPEVQIELKGRPNRHVVLRSRAAHHEEWLESALEGRAAADYPATRVFGSKLDKLTADVQYQFVTSAGSTPVFTLSMQPKIVMLESSVTVLPPAYTQLPERVFNTEEVTVLVGSKVTVHLQTNRALKMARFMTGAPGQELSEVALARTEDGSIWKVELPSDRDLRWQFSGAGEDDAPLAPIQGRLRVRQDEAPRLEWQSPADELVVNMLAEVPMRVLVSDDYGLTQAGMVFQLGENEEFVLKEWNLRDSSNPNPPGKPPAVTTRLRLEEILPLESFALSERDFVSYYAFAEDNRDGQSQHAESEVRYLDIRPLKQYFREQDAPPNGGGGTRSFPLLEELISRERYLYNRTRVISRHYEASSPDQLRTLERMVETQSELADFTRYLIEFLVSQGNDANEALAQAEAAMLQASDALATADFETAILREQDAIRLLVEAKNSGEIALPKTATPAMRAQLNAFQRNLLTRLRRKTKPAETKLADDLRQIANEQKQLAKRVTTWLQTSTGDQVRSAPAASDLKASLAVSPASDPAEPSVENSSTTASEEPNSAAEKSPEEQLKSDQQELLDRLTAIHTDLSEPLKGSALATERLATVLMQMDRLTSESNQAQWENYPNAARALADDLMELGQHVKAVLERDATKRIASLRDLTADLANQEIEFANRLDQTRPESPETAQSNVDDGELPRQAKAVSARAATIRDVLSISSEGGDLRTGDILDQLERLVTTQRFRENLQASTQFASDYAQATSRENSGVTTRDRAQEHAHMAQLLDQLHRQLVAPRLEQLRRMESKATQLANAIGSCILPSSNSNGQGGVSDPTNITPKGPLGGGGDKPISPENEKTIGHLQSELQSQLENAGLTELAELLAGYDNPANQAEKDQAGLAGSDRSGMGRAAGGSAASHFSPNRLHRGHQSAMLVRQKLQALLQELILLESTVDRNTPVPSQYKELVDEYYKTLAGQ